jgi:DNA processing protein
MMLKRDRPGDTAVGPFVLTPTEVLGPLTDVEEKNAPSKLYLAGDTSLLAEGPRISIVGSRQASAEGLKRARFLARALVGHDMIVVSGLAEGIDTAAHTATIEAGGRTIAVIGTPLDQVYPKANAELQARLMREHLVVSQFPAGYRTQPKSFPMRNRTMALLTDATVIVEAGEKSGTLHQGWEALRLGRQLFLMESVAMDPALTWPAEMIRYGAHVLRRESLDEALADLPSVTVRGSMSLADVV